MKRFEVNFTDATGATSPIDTIEVEDGYTAADYISDCAEYADEDWNEMLKNGTVTLVEIDEK